MIVTGPQTPPLSPQILAKAEHLAWWIHAGGSIKSVAPESVFDRGVRCFTAKGRRAATVGEWCLGALLTLLRQVNRELGITMVLVTHDLHVAEQADRIIQLEDGKIALDSGVMQA